MAEAQPPDSEIIIALNNNQFIVNSKATYMRPFTAFLFATAFIVVHFAAPTIAQKFEPGSSLVVEQLIQIRYDYPDLGDSVYGSGGAAWDIANTVIKSDVTFSQTFIPTTTANLTGFRGYLMDEAGGYGAGTGGILHFEIQTDSDDGFASGIQVGTGYAEAVHSRPNGLIFSLHTFNPPILVQAGTRYHLVVSNTDSAANDNYVSMNDVYKGTGPIVANSCNVKYGDSSWRRRGNDGFYYVPIGEYHYDNGVIDGFGYIHAMTHNQHKHEISNRLGVRELITVSGGDKSVGDLHYYAQYIEGSGVIVATLRASGLDMKRIPTSISAQDSRNGQWFTFPFNMMLTDGESYELEFIAESDGRYNALIFRNGASYGYSSQSEFADGYAQYSETAGVWSNWKIWGSSSIQGDLMFYFELK